MSEVRIAAASDRKEDLYAAALAQLDAVLDPLVDGAEPADAVADMATTAAVLRELLPDPSWVGFYRVVAPELLRIGPYQGPLGCLEIRFDRGVCGAAARQRQTQLVPDVALFPGHVACDAGARSEIVVPVLDRDGAVLAVIDLDSHAPAAFDEDDRRGLEAIARRLGDRWSSR